VTFFLSYPSAKDFYSFVLSMSKVTDNLSINITPEGMNGRYVEPDTKSLMVILDISKSYFSSYEIEKPISVELNLASLRKVLSKARSKNATVEISETDSGMKITVIDGKLGTKSNIYLTSRKSDVISGVEPKVSHNVKLTLTSDVLDRVVGDSSIISDAVYMRAEGEEVKMEASEEGKEYSVVMRKEKPLKYLDLNGSAESKFRVELLKQASNIMANFSTVDVEIGTGIPMKLRGEADAGGQIVIWIAPVV